MSDFGEWIAAAGHDEDATGTASFLPTVVAGDRLGSSAGSVWQQLGGHNFSLAEGPGVAQEREDRLDRNPDLWMYRGRSVGLLRRYLRFSLETGRLPSMGGGEFFRAKITSYKAVTFEDRVIFVRDVEKCMKRLAYGDQHLIECVIFQEHNHTEAAYMLHCTRKTIQRRVPEVLDELSEDFLQRKLLTAMPPRRRRGR
jgi:hypothetical protein